MHQPFSLTLPKKNLLWMTCALASVLLASGCSTGQPASASFASVVIPGKTPDEICQTTAQVFQEEGYKVRGLNPAAMVFEREGTRGESLAYSGVVDTHYGAVTLVRVKAELVDLGAGSYRLQCKAFMVKNANDSFFADESPLMNIRGHPYQKLLDETAKRLK
jgi:hypothetical protein